MRIWHTTGSRRHYRQDLIAMKIVHTLRSDIINVSTVGETTLRGNFPP